MDQLPRLNKMMKYLDDISWETEVWVAESPTHLIHFNGERFLGPYEEGELGGGAGGIGDNPTETQLNAFNYIEIGKISKRFEDQHVFCENLITQTGREYGRESIKHEGSGEYGSIKWKTNSQKSIGHF